MSREPASIRYNNPGAMWGGNAISRKWGETGNVALADGTGQGNHIAVFPSKVHGAAAQFDLWHTSKNYHNKKLSAALRTWSGGNSVDQYIAFLVKRVPGLTSSTVIDDKFLASPSGVLFVKAQAWHEAGKPYPMSDAEWRQAQEMVFGTAVASAPTAQEGSVEKPPSPKAKPARNWIATARQSAVGVGAVLAAFTDWKVLATAGVLLIAAYAIWNAHGKPKFWKGEF